MMRVKQREIILESEIREKDELLENIRIEMIDKI